MKIGHLIINRKYWLLISVCCALAAAGILLALRLLPAQEMATLYTACGHVTALVVDGHGTAWAATTGGLLHWSSLDAAPLQWTTAAGLAGNELRALAVRPEGVAVATACSLQLITPGGQVRNVGRTLAGQEIRGLCAAREGCLVGTDRGVYQVADNAVQRRWAGNVRRLVEGGAKTWVVTDTELVCLPEGRHWNLPDTEGNVTALAAVGERLYLATTSGCWQFSGGKWQAIPLPDNGGSHVSALAVQGDDVLLALYGDGIYRLAGNRLTRMKTPAPLQFTTALCLVRGGLLAGTRDAGVWRRQGNAWHACPMPPCLPSADIYGIARYGRALWVSTFDQGLLRLEGRSCRRITAADGLSTDSPRDLVVFRNRLFVRHTTGEVDVYNGFRWHKALPPWVLPRQGVYAMSTDGRRLYVGVWAGWAATDGRRWEYHFHEKALQKDVITAIAGDGETVWVGTHRDGLFAFRAGAVTQYHESHGLTDDWITRIAVHRGRVLVGTYTGGLLEWTGAGFTRRLSAQGFAIRAIAFPGDRLAAVATPLGVFREQPGGWRLLPPSQYGGLETQALLADRQGLWIGSRTALAYAARP